jgi:hypothetical protein
LNQQFSKIIGLVVGQKSLFLAEVSAKPVDSGRPIISALVEFPYPENVSINTPADLGKALASFVKSQKFSTKDVIIGLPARRLLTRKKDVPPVPENLAADTLRLQAETEFPAPSDAAPFAVDYVGETSTAQPSTVLLVATQPTLIDQCNELAKAAGLKLRGITSATAALGRASATLAGNSAKANADGLVVALSSGAAELVVQHNNNSTQLRHIAVPNAGSPESIGALAGEIRRTVATLTPNGNPLTLALWEDNAGDSGAAGTLLGQRLGIPVTTATLRHNTLPANRPENLNAFAPAIAVAISALDRAGPPVDFLHSRLTAPVETTNKRPIIIGVSIAAVLLLAVIAGFLDLHFKQSELDKLNSAHNAKAADLKTAQIAADRLREAKKWTARKPRYVECLRDLTKLFPKEGTNIWITDFTLKPDNKGAVSGKALSESHVRTLIKHMADSKMFLAPTLAGGGIHDSPSPVRGAPPEKAFTIEFTYKAAE